MSLQSERDYYVYYSVDPKPELGVAAVRWSHYKAHYHSKGYTCTVYIVATCLHTNCDMNYAMYMYMYIITCM